MLTNPKSQKSWLQLTSIQVGGSICLPVMMVGHVLSKNYGLYTALIAIMLGNLVLLTLGLAAASIGAKARKSTVEQAAFYFGDQGSAFFALLMICCMLGWFAIQLDLMHESARAFWHGLGLPNCLLFLAQ
jgi:purine-cytosine permease-like protein